MAEANYPQDLLYHPEHDWARIDPAGEGGSDFIATLGITWYAQDALGEVVFFDPPAVGTTLVKDEPYAEVESVKAVSDVLAPLSGEIVEVNGDLRRGLAREDPDRRAGRARGAAGRRRLLGHVEWLGARKRLRVRLIPVPGGYFLATS
jgi:glycine cleavage system H protein